MAKLNAVESDLKSACLLLANILGPDEFKEIVPLIEASEMGMRSFRVLSAIRPLIASVWSSMASNGDPNRFAVENMLHDIDKVLCYWVVSDEKEVNESSEK